MSTPIYYAGRVHSVVYENAANAFYILKMVLDGGPVGALTTVKGSVPGLHVAIGTWFGFEARWVTDETYGKQLTITQAPVLKGAWDADTACKMLESNGVGPTVMQAIRVQYPGEALLAALGDTAKLEAVPGMTVFSAQHVVGRWEAVQAHFKGMAYLSGLGLPAGVVREVWSHFGDKAQKVLATNPWALVEVDGISFANADEVARKSGIVIPDLRMRGAVLYACKANRSFGHMFLRTGSILQTVEGYIGDVSKEQVLSALAGLHRDGLLVIDRKTRHNTAAVYEPWCHKAESESATLLLGRVVKAAFVPGAERTENYLTALGSVGPLTRAAVASGDVPTTVRIAIEEWGTQARLSLSDPQKDGIFNALTAPVSVLTGLPGTGKTTSLRAAVRILQDAGVPFLLCAPTGIAAKNLASRTGASASTIHRAFSAKGAREGQRESTYAGVVGDGGAALASGDSEWGYSPDNPYPADVVIIDEASMMDQNLLYQMLRCTREDARLVFVGDHAQLPSVGPGNVLRDLIGSGVFPTVKLLQIFRQDDTSGIVYAAHSIHAGEVPEINKDFKLLVKTTEDEVLAAVLKIGVKFFDERRNFQILSPKHNGTVGVTNLNSRLRELLNPASPGKAETRLGDDAVREGDRIMITQNDYKLGVFNGDVGKIDKVDRTKKEIVVKIFGDVPLYVTIDFKSAAKLIRLAYACTVHKAQGLEYDAVVMPLVTGFYHQLQRNLLYTAITRARKQVILVGHHEALATAVLNAKEDDRATLFLDRLVPASA